MPAQPYFSKQTFEFMKDLADHNSRNWFNDNKPRYEEHIKAASLSFIEDFAPHLAKLSSNFHAGPRSLFRIYRDTRFSKDKTPYKTHTGIHFRHDRAKDAHAPGYYFHMEPGQCFVGLGIWHPDSKALRAIREHIVEEPAAWKKATRGKAFTAAMSLRGDRLKRAPKGFDPAHPLIDDLLWKDYIAIRDLPQSFALSPDLPKELHKIWKTGTPFMRFLCDALGVPF